MIDGARAELDGERDRSGLGELIAVQAQRQAGEPARLEVAARLGRVKGAPLEKHVGRVRDASRIG